MRGDIRAARRYARALFQLALERNEVDSIAAGLREVAQVAGGSRELMQVLNHPRITRQRKKELLSHVFGGALRTDIERFLFLLVERERAGIILSVASEFEHLLDEYRREVDAEAVTTVPLSAAQEAALLQRLQAATGYTVRLKTRVDESILGGLVVRIGDRLIDGSVRARLEVLREQLKQAKVT
ncbi:MAG TPA: F0F1 ATP synthase subunit delta [Abditibacteriaceae bacterium]